MRVACVIENQRDLLTGRVPVQDAASGVLVIDITGVDVSPAGDAAYPDREWPPGSGMDRDLACGPDGFEMDGGCETQFGYSKASGDEQAGRQGSGACDQEPDADSDHSIEN
ncbi:hypothetical protein BG000_004358, partial [Podila horticola]